MYKKILLLITAAFFAVACKTTEDPTLFESSNLPGMIYDGENRPCERVKIQTIKITEEGPEELYIVETDINGRFTLPGLDRGNYKIVAAKEGFETLESYFSYASRVEVLYLKMYSQEQILIMAADEIEKGRFGKAMELLERSASIDKINPLHLYTQAVYYYRTGEYEAALEPLEEILAAGYNFPWVYLLMGDIYQYHLQDNEKALTALKKFSTRVDDGEVNLRIKELENQ